ncbi:MAG: 50S ribosomal protein L4 [Bdellovibrionales bacterium CG10_big_fil_rev_8_21_14_0_10_45_34]|nr:MAG: 50S ribosomal protein L4 [Bdellovibrionales bacterium CG10_big_fil_rev_8_21_14_0_10_45_34]
MAKAKVYSWDKSEVGSVELNDAIYGAPVRKDILHEVVRWQLASRRQGTHKVKTRAFVSGGGKKPFKQKGTGNARQGSTRSPLNPGGAVLFGPQPRDYSYVLPKKVKKIGLRSALSYLNGEGRLYVVDSIQSNGKTSEFNSKLKGFGLVKAVVVDKAEEAMVKRASRNLKAYRYLSVEGLNVYDLLKYDAVVINKQSLDKIEERLG